MIHININIILPLYTINVDNVSVHKMIGTLGRPINKQADQIFQGKFGPRTIFCCKKMVLHVGPFFTPRPNFSWHMNWRHTTVCSHSLLCKNNLNKLFYFTRYAHGTWIIGISSQIRFIWYQNHLNCRLGTCWTRKHNTRHSLIINTFIGPVFTMEELAFHTINTFYFWWG